MSQENQGTSSAAQETLVPVKRKRGRPRKDENPSHGEKSSTTPEPDVVKRNRRRRIDPSASAENALVGQLVSGVLDGSFDAGYLVTVRVGNTNTILRGIVFEPGLSVPISGANDVAPNVKMYKRNEIPIPVVTSPPNPVPVFTPQSGQKKDRPVKLQRNETNHVSQVVPKKSQPESRTESLSPLISKGRPEAGSQINKGKSMEILQKNESTVRPGRAAGDANHAIKTSPKAIQSSELKSQKAIPVGTEASPLVDKTEKPVEVLKENERKGSVSDVGAPKDLKRESKTEKPGEILQANKTAKIMPNAINQENNSSPSHVPTNTKVKNSKRDEVTQSTSMGSIDAAKEDLRSKPKTDQTAETLRRTSKPQKSHPTRPTKVDTIVSKGTISTLQSPSESGGGV